MAGDGGDGGIEDDGHQTAGEAVVIQVHSRHRRTGGQHHRGVEKAGQHAVGPAEIARDGGQGGAEQAGQLDGGVAEGPVHHETAQKDPGHHRDDVARVLAEGGKAHDGQDPAGGGAVEVAAAQQDEGHADQPVDPGVDKDRGGAQHTQIVGGGPAAGLEQTAVARPDRPDGLAAQEQAGQDAGQAEQKEQQSHGQITVGGPAVMDGGVRPHGGHQGDADHGRQPAGEAHVVEVHAVLHLIGVGGQGGHQKTDGGAGEDTGHGGVQAALQRDVADQGGEGGGHQPDGGVFSKGLPPAFGVQPGAQQDGADVGGVFPKEGEA